MPAHETTAAASAAPRRRWRVSLLTLLLLVTCATLGWGLWAADGRNERLAAVNDRLATDNAKYRNELGIFEVQHPDRLNAIRFLSQAADYCYRVYVPPGRRWELVYETQNLPRIGAPSRGNRVHDIDPGEYVFEFSKEKRSSRQRDETADKFVFRIRVHPQNGQPSFGLGIRVDLNGRESEWR